jgi:hypothetical protein
MESSKIFSSWQKYSGEYLDHTAKRTIRGIKRAFSIRKISANVSLENLFNELTVFGFINDLCITKKHFSSNYHHRQKKRIAFVEFRHKKAAAKFAASWIGNAFFKDLQVDALFIKRKSIQYLRTPPGFTRVD